MSLPTYVVQSRRSGSNLEWRDEFEVPFADLDLNKRMIDRKNDHAWFLEFRLCERWTTTYPVYGKEDQKNNYEL